MEEAFEQEVERTVAALKAGKTILYPTDTIWGVGCDATNNKACLRVYAVKQRPLNRVFFGVSLKFSHSWMMPSHSAKPRRQMRILVSG